MTKADSGVMNIKKKVANLKQELDEANDRANNAEATLREKEVAIDKVSLGTQHDFSPRYIRLAQTIDQSSPWPFVYVGARSYLGTLQPFRLIPHLCTIANVSFLTVPSSSSRSELRYWK